MFNSRATTSGSIRVGELIREPVDCCQCHLEPSSAAIATARLRAMIGEGSW
jgi:hypothetical protein